MSEDQYKIIPIFHDHSSKRSLITAWKESECKEGGPTSVVQLAKQHRLKEIFLVSKNFHHYIEAFDNLKEIGVSLRYGVEMMFCQNIKERSDAGTKTNHKNIIWIKNDQGYKDMIKLYSACHTDVNNKYYVQRFDYEQLKPYWTENLLMTIPFFDSYIHTNTLKYGGNIIPDYPEIPVLMEEVNSTIPFAPLIQGEIDKLQNPKIKVKTIYYNKYSDFKAWQVYRARNERNQFDKPELPFCSSNTFCFEDYLKLTVS